MPELEIMIVKKKYRERERDAHTHTSPWQSVSSVKMFAATFFTKQSFWSSFGVNTNNTHCVVDQMLSPVTS